MTDPPVIQDGAVEAVLDPSHPVERQPEGCLRTTESWPVVPVHAGEKLEAVERKLLLATLQAVNGDRRTAAELLGISLKTVYNRLKQYGLEHYTIPGGRTRGS